jgi:transposase
MSKFREILRLSSLGLSQRSIASSCECSRNTVSDVLSRATLKGVFWPLPDEITETDLKELLFPERVEKAKNSPKIPDCEYIHRELNKSGVTLSLLWTEYAETCRKHQQIPLKYTQFCNYYRKFATTTKASMNIHRKPGEQLEVDWAGQSATVIDRETGEAIPVSIFVAVLSYSQYAYVEGFLSQNQESWINAHLNAFSFFSGVPKILVPDNLKTGVEKADWYTPVINKTYHEMAEHYGIAVIPARVRKPKDKPNAEGTVNIVSTWILAALRNHRFFSLEELNQTMFQKLDEINSRSFQKKPGNRYSAFLDEEKSSLLPLPVTAYELAAWKVATVHINYHISIDRMHYSVPYEYIQKKVDVRITTNIIEVFYQHQRICSHPRLIGKAGQYHTVEAHMPENHKQYIQWNGDRFLDWARRVGQHTTVVIQGILTAHRIEQQGYRSCLGILKLADKYSLTRLEAACAKALTFTPTPSYKNISAVLQSGQDKIEIVEPSAQPQQTESAHGFTRGASYYGRKQP